MSQQAFPCEREYGPKFESSDGMTLRDYFAAKAMQELLSQYGYEMFSVCAKDAFLMADAMLKEREAQP